MNHYTSFYEMVKAFVKKRDGISNPTQSGEKSGVVAFSDFSPEILRARNDKVSL
ncbi:MAG: hypothetical protein ACE5HX_13720 [bacterium]